MPPKKKPAKKKDKKSEPWVNKPKANIFYYDETIQVRIFNHYDSWNNSPDAYCWEAVKIEPIKSGVARINGVAPSEEDAVKQVREWAKKIWGEK